jgi:hypothetical protein
MEDRKGSTGFMIVAMLALLLVPLLIVGGVLLGARDPDPSTAPKTPASPALSEPAGTGRDRPAVTSRPRTMVDQHQAMMDQMRASVAPTMVDQMNRDPMWQMLRSEAFIGRLEQHENDIDRMLAAGG